MSYVLGKDRPVAYSVTWRGERYHVKDWDSLHAAAAAIVEELHVHHSADLVRALWHRPALLLAVLDDCRDRERRTGSGAEPVSSSLVLEAGRLDWQIAPYGAAAEPAPEPRKRLRRKPAAAPPPAARPARRDPAEQLALGMIGCGLFDRPDPAAARVIGGAFRQSPAEQAAAAQASAARPCRPARAAADPEPGTRPPGEVLDDPAAVLVREFSPVGPCLRRGELVKQTAKFFVYREFCGKQRDVRIAKAKAHIEPCTRCEDHPRTCYPDGYMD